MEIIILDNWICMPKFSLIMNANTYVRQIQNVIIGHTPLEDLKKKAFVDFLLKMLLRLLHNVKLNGLAYVVLKFVKVNR